MRKFVEKILQANKNHELGLILFEVGVTWFLICLLIIMVTFIGLPNVSVDAFFLGLVGLGISIVGIFWDGSDSSI
jgi:hypothetical protein